MNHFKKFFWFWDHFNDELEFLDDEGEFHLYGEDSVAMEQSGGKKGQFWLHIDKLTDETPLRDWTRYDVMDPATGLWLKWEDAPDPLVRKVRRHCGVRDWKDFA